jgi:hypothetical protein
MRFASEDWIRALIEAVNGHPDLPRALSGLGADLAAVVEADPPVFPRSVSAWGRQAGGRIGDWRLLEDEDEILELEPAYVVRAPYRVWKELVRRRLDPLQAAMSGAVKVKGDLESLVRRSGYRYVIEAALAGVATEFADDARGRA